MLIGMATYGGFFVRDLAARETVFRAATVAECRAWCAANRPGVSVELDEGIEE